MSKPGTSSTKQHFYAGTTAGLVSATLLYPIDLVKVRYQVYDKSGNAYRSITGAFQTIVREEGVRGLFNGLAPATLASAISWGGYIYLYEHAKKRKLSHCGGEGGGGDAGAPRQLSTVDHLLAGVEAGVYMVFLTNPLWLIKTRLQIQHNPRLPSSAEGPSTATAKTNYKGSLDAVRVILREEGPTGFYRGLLPALFLTSHGAVQFAVYEQFKATFKTFQAESEQHSQPAVVSMVTGFMSKIIASTLTYPPQVMKSRLQQRGELRPVTLSCGRVEMQARDKYAGVLDCAMQIWRGEGLRGFFRGLVPNCLKVAPSAALTFLVYEETLKLLNRCHMGAAAAAD